MRKIETIKLIAGETPMGTLTMATHPPFLRRREGMGGKRHQVSVRELRRDRLRAQTP